MKLKFWSSVLALLSLLVVIPACQPSQYAAALIDDSGQEIKFDKVPERIISHVPGITETLFALGLDNKVVGVDTYSNYPEAAKSKEKIGGYFDPSVEKIASLKPDLVFTDGYVKNLIPQLSSLGIRHVVLQPKGVNGIMKNIGLVGKITGTESRADKLTKDLQERISSVAEKVKNSSRPRVLYVFDTTDLNNPWTAGSGSYADELMALAGGENLGAKAPAPWAQLSIEQIVSSDPEILVIDASMGTSVIKKEVLEQHPAWQKITALKQGKVYAVNGDLVNRAGPRIVDGLEALAKIIHPELFK